jgi:hypothetical protein
LRRRTECRFTVARFLMFLAFESPRSRLNLRPVLPEGQRSYVPRNSHRQTLIGLFLGRPVRHLNSQLHLAGLLARTDVYLCCGAVIGDSSHRVSR